MNHYEVTPGDVLLLTSDGIHDNLTTAEIEAVLITSNPQYTTASLANRAQMRTFDKSARSKDDDMTAVVVRI